MNIIDILELKSNVELILYFIKYFIFVTYNSRTPYLKLIIFQMIMKKLQKEISSSNSEYSYNKESTLKLLRIPYSASFYIYKVFEMR